MIIFFIPKQYFAVSKTACKILFKNPKEYADCIVKVSEQKTASYRSISDCEKEKDKYAQSSCFKKIAKELKDITICDKEEVMDKGECYMGVAESSGKGEICESLHQFPVYDFQIENCFENAAITSGNIEYCKKLKYDYDQIRCIGKVGESKADIKLCNKLKEDYDLISVGGKSYFEDCVIAVAKRLKSTEYCDLMFTLPRKEFCLKQVNQ